MTSIEIDNCIKRMAKGDKDSFYQLYLEFKSSVYFFALTITKNNFTAEDIMQETFITIWNKSEDYLSFGKGKSWIMGITRNLCRNYLRKSEKEPLIFVDNDEDYTYSLENSLVHNDEYLHLNNTVFEKMTVLNNKEKDIVVLHILAGFKHKEIAKLMNLPLGSVLWTYNNSLKKLRKEIIL